MNLLIEGVSNSFCFLLVGDFSLNDRSDFADLAGDVSADPAGVALLGEIGLFSAFVDNVIEQLAGRWTISLRY